MEQGTWKSRAGAILWMACVQFFLFEQIVRRGWSLPYSFANNYVSDLGASLCLPNVCSPWHSLMNASFVLQGILIAGGAVLTSRHFGFLGRIGLGLLLLCGVGVIVVGFVPEDTSIWLHQVGAALHFLGAGLGMIAVGASLRKLFGGISVVLGVSVVAVTVELGQGGGRLGDAMGIGTLERIAAYGIAGWMAALGVWSYLHYAGRGRERV